MTPRDDTAVDELQRQVERASLFTHTALGENALRLGELQAFLHGLADALLAKGAVDGDELAASIRQAEAELRARGELNGAGAVLRVDAEAGEARAAARVDCRARLHVCHAVCCRLDFALSVEEVEAGRLKFDLGRPYFVRRAADGRCAHLDADTCGCSVYAERPQVCRHYDCTHDARIWSDFDAMRLNQAWIDEHLQADPGPHAVRVFMHDAGTGIRRAGEPGA